MDLTLVKITLDTNPQSRGLLGTALLIFDGILTVREVKIIRDKTEMCFLEFPGYPQVGQCPVCFKDNTLASNYCCRCGGPLKPLLARDKLDNVVHPNNTDFRVWLTDQVLEEYVKEKAAHDRR